MHVLSRNHILMVTHRNYGSALVGGVLMLNVAFWFIYGRASGYQGPPIDTVGDETVILGRDVEISPEPQLAKR